MGPPQKKIALLSLLVILPLLGWSAAGAWPWVNLNLDAVHELASRVTPTLELGPLEERQAVSIARQALSAPSDAPVDPPRELGEAFSLRDLRPVWVTLFVEGHGAVTAMGQSSSLYRSLRQAARLAQLKARALPGLDPRAALGDLPLQVDILDGSSALDVRAPALAYFALEPGVHGLRLSRGETILGYIPPSDPLYRGVLTGETGTRLDHNRALLTDALNALSVEAPPEEVDVTRFTTRAFVSLRPGAVPLAVYRGNTARPGDGSEDLRASLLDAGRWLSAQVQPDGQFRYGYLPSRDETLEGYNAVRHAGTVFGMLYVGRRLGDSDTLEAAARALPWVRDALARPDEADPATEDMLCLKVGDTRSTGGAALSLLALLEAPEALREPEDDARAAALGRFLTQMIDPEGRVFYGWYISTLTDEVVDEPAFYPGEAMLALARLHAAQGDADALAGALRIARRQVRGWHLAPNGWADHWVIQALVALDPYAPGEGLGEVALSMAHASLDGQYPFNIPPFPDYFGHYRFPTTVTRATRTGSRSEAIAAAMRFAWSSGADARRLEDSVIFAAKALRTQMFHPSNAYWLPNPDAALGGMRAGPLDDTLRIDFNQHGMVGLIGGLEATLKREGRPIPWLNAPTHPGVSDGR